MKKVSLLVALVAVFALAAAPAGAVWNGLYLGDIDAAVNYDTGNGSFNYAKSTDNDSITVDNYDKAKVENDVDTYASTGYNGAGGNSGNVDIATGDAVAAATVSNQVNYILTEINDSCGCEDDGILGAGNALTGKHSWNYAFATDNDSILVKNVKKAKVENKVDTYAETGWNGAEGNGGEYHRWVHEESSETTWSGGHHHLFLPEGHHGGSNSWWSYSETVTRPMGGDVNITTGDATAASGVVNVVNTDITRITRGYMAE